jgi:glucose-1-phosphate cytidylyltransferase
MKVVLFCGGLGLRMREADERIPKPMVTLGNRPILWHVMKYYAHFGHNDFILCLGHKAEVIKSYFLQYDETVSNDFVITKGGRQVELLKSDIDDWRITFVDTGLRATVGQRLRAVRTHLEGGGIFLANYGDVLTDAPLPVMIDAFRDSGKVGGMLCVRPTYSFHLVTVDANHTAVDIQDVTRSDLWINGGYFMFREEIFDYLNAGEDLVAEPFDRLVDEQRLLAYRYEGFWAPMDTLKDRTNLEALIESGNTPWRLWENGESAGGERTA